MSWSYLRRDFLPSQSNCVFCHRPLHSEKGIVICDVTGAEAFAGPGCAKKHLGLPEERLLDVTRLALLVVAAGPADSTTEPPLAARQAQNTGDDSPSAPQAPRPPLPPIDEVVQYIRFRCEAMTNFKFAVSKVLKEAHDSFVASGQISDGLRKQIGGSMRNAGTQSSVLSLANVKRCIGVEHWLSEAVQHTQVERREFLVRMLAHLHRYWMLSPNQMAAINRWGENIRRRVDDFPMLEEAAFEGVTLPEFMQRKAPSPR